MNKGGEGMFPQDKADDNVYIFVLRQIVKAVCHGTSYT